MIGSRRILVAAVLAVASLASTSAPSLATVATVRMDFFDGLGTVAFDGSTLTASASTTADVITVNEDYPLSGFTNMSFSLTTTYDSEITWGPDVLGKFIGGQLSIEFDDGVDFYYVNGTILDLYVGITVAISGPPASASLIAPALFEVVDANLPLNPTGVWPELYGWLDALEFDTSDDLTGYDWSAPTPWSGTTTERQVYLIPSVTPEPATVGVLALGAMIALTRRR